ncbi:MAG: S41 family peptidase [Kofleriaceae bacterium]
MRALAVVLLAAACGSKPAPAPEHAEPPKTDDAESAELKPTADAIVHVYEALTVKTVAPGPAGPIREAAVAALGWTAPIPWTTDPSKDRDLIRGTVRALANSHRLPKDAVLRAARAMGVWSGDLQTYGVDPSGFASLFGLIGGQAVVQAGIVFHKDGARWAVADVLQNGAAQRAGVMRGDILLTIDGAPIAHGWKDFQYLLGAPNGTRANLVIEHVGQQKTVQLNLAPVNSPIVDAKILGKGAGYIRVWTCTHSDNAKLDAAALVQKALADFDRKGVKKLVIDLRGNAGGFPFDLASLFTEDDLLMYARPISGDDEPIARTKIAVEKVKRPIAVLVDEATASGAEMVALALKEHAGAIIVGQPTAGGLTFPTTEKLVGNVTLSYPTTRVGTFKDKTVLEGNRLEPDVVAPNQTLDDYQQKRDPQLDAALAKL